MTETKHNPRDCPQAGSVYKIGCGCDGAYDNGCHYCLPKVHSGWCNNCDGTVQSEEDMWAENARMMRGI